jgi:Cu(I)/Ag(I) efflux system membrane fusion protein
VVDNIYVKRAGQVVRKGDPLFDLHSSELFFLEQELFETIEKFPFMLNIQQSRGHGKERLGRWAKVILPGKSGKSAEVEIDEEQKKAAEESLGRIRNKMRLMGLSKKAIDRVMIRGKPSGIATITTPMTGVVLEQNAYRGAYVNTGDLVFTIANPRVLWVRLDAYASDFPWIRLGQEVEFETDAYPGMTLKGKIVFIDPEFNPETLVFKVGALYTDRKGLLKPNMLVRGVILASMKSGGESVTEVATRSMKGIPKMKRTNLAPLVIPDTAPLITGERAIVYVQVPDKPGNYVGREVKLGPRGKGYYIVKNGLHKGEMVVVNGNFKIDSAVQILAKSSMMTQKAGKLPVDHYRHVESPPIPTEAKAGQAAHKHVKSRKLKMRPTSRKEARKELEERLQRRRQSE